jgi:hypothetical protein
MSSPGVGSETAHSEPARYGAAVGDLGLAVGGLVRGQLVHRLDIKG